MIKNVAILTMVTRNHIILFLFFFRTSFKIGVIRVEQQFLLLTVKLMKNVC